MSTSSTSSSTVSEYLELPELTVPVWNAPVQDFAIRAPGSKSLTNRALAIASMADGPSVLTGALDSDDTQVMVQALRALGVQVEHDLETATIRVQGCRGRFPAQQADLFLGNSGTSLRFLASMVSASRGTYRLDGVPRMRQRPIGDLLQSLNGLGAVAQSEFGNGCPPITITASGLDGGYAFVKGDVSSQFLSGLLMALPYSKETTTIEVSGNLVSKPYVDMTMKVMEAFGIQISNRKYKRFDIQPARYHGRPYEIEPDASAASYFMALAAIAKGRVVIEGLGTQSLQGDVAFAEVLEFMGCRVQRSSKSITVERTNQPLIGVDVDMNAISDTVMTLAVTALFAQGITKIQNVAHIRHKETDRLHALAIELRKLGATIDEKPDGLVIVPPPKITPAKIATYDDHRMAMSFALAGTVTEGIVILDPKCVAKTYPRFWDDLERARVESEARTQGK